MRNSPMALFAGSLGFLLPVLVSPNVIGDAWSVRYAALAVVLLVGTASLPRLWRSAHRTLVVVMLIWLAWAWASALLSPQPALAVWGLFLTGTGALFIGSLVAAWAVGALAGDRGSRLTTFGLIAAVLTNSAVAVLQTVFDLESMHLPLIDGRAPGLMGNPVFLGALLAGGLWLVLDLSRSSGAWTIAILPIAISLQLSGSRLALALVVAALAVHTLRAGPRRAGVAAGLVIAGLLLGAGIAANAGTVTGTSRLADQPSGGGGLAMRTATWKTAPAAIAERPLLGFGPGRYGAATAPHRTRELAAIAPDQYYADAHNLVVEYAVTTGLPGVALMVAVLAAAFRRLRWSNPLAGFAVILLVSHGLEPQHVALTPLLFLALGLSAASPARMGPAPPRPLSVVAPIVGTLAAAWFLVGVFQLDQGRLDFSERNARAGMAKVPPWPESRTLLARIHTFEAARVPARRTEETAALLRWRAAAVSADPADPRLWNNLADAQMVVGRPGLALSSYSSALRLDPWSVRALNGRGAIYGNQGRSRDAESDLTRSLEVKPEQPAIRKLLISLTLEDR